MVYSLLSKDSCSNICYLELTKATSKSMLKCALFVLSERVSFNHRVLHLSVIAYLHKIAYSFAPTETQTTPITMGYMFNLSTTVFIHGKKKNGLVLITAKEISNFSKPKIDADANKGMWVRKQSNLIVFFQAAQ